MKPTLFRKPRLKPISDHKRAADKACPDAGWKRLSNEQKGRLSVLARKAYAHQRVQGMTETEWRHEIAISVCGCRISEAVQDHYTNLKSAFEDLCGEHDRAFKTQIRGADNKRRIALHKLATACKERGLHDSYPESICRSQFKVPISQASAKQIWCLFFTVTKRREKQ